MTANTGRKAAVFKEYVQQAFEAAVADFRADPSANNWLDLKLAMWVWQHVHSAQGNLPDAAHEHLFTIAAAAKGDTNFSEGS